MGKILNHNTLAKYIIIALNKQIIKLSSEARKQAKHICEHCGKSFTRLQYRKKHEAKFHGIGEMNVKDFPCPHCDVVYHIKDHLKRHSPSSTVMCVQKNSEKEGI